MSDELDPLDRHLVRSSIAGLVDADVPHVVEIHQNALDGLQRARTQNLHELKSIERSIAMRTLALQLLDARDGAA